MAEGSEGYGWYTPHDFDEYLDNIIGKIINNVISESFNDTLGDYGKELEKVTFTDSKKTNYLDTVKFVADLVWNEYQVKQAEAHPDPNSVSNFSSLKIFFLSILSYLYMIIACRLW